MERLPLSQSLPLTSCFFFPSPTPSPPFVFAPSLSPPLVPAESDSFRWRERVGTIWFACGVSRMSDSMRFRRDWVCSVQFNIQFTSLSVCVRLRKPLPQLEAADSRFSACCSLFLLYGASHIVQLHLLYQQNACLKINQLLL